MTRTSLRPLRSALVCHPCPGLLTDRRYSNCASTLRSPPRPLPPMTVGPLANADFGGSIARAIHPPT
ncbi:MAG: hypothetical protein AAF622_10190 [Cyanobacteria bacterium P01_C01_bin.147]